jgi:hypothetical protein
MGQAPRTDLRKDQFARTDNDLVSFFFVFLNVNARLLRFAGIRIKAPAPSFMNLYVQSVPRLIDEVVAIRDEQPNLLIRTSCVFARKIQMHDASSTLISLRFQLPA